MSLEKGSVHAPPWLASPGRPWLWLSASRLPVDGGHLAVAAVNPTDRALTYGVMGYLDRWDGHGWVGAGQWSGALDFWGTFGNFAEQVTIPAIGIGAAPHRLGPVEYLAVPALPSGWYRLGVQGAYGLLQVAADAAAAIDITNPSALTASPTLIPTTGSDVRLGASPAPGMRPDTFAGVTKTLAPFVTLEGLEHGAWSEVSRLKVNTGPADPAQTIRVPPLAAGWYRLTRVSPTLGALHRHIWTLEPPPGITLDRPSHDT